MRRFAADAVVIRVNELQAATIQYCGPAPTCAPGTIDTQLARQIVETSIALRQTLKAVPAGWQASVKAAWKQARPRFAAIQNPAIVAALAAVDLVIGVFDYEPAPARCPDSEIGIPELSAWLKCCPTMPAKSSRKKPHCHKLDYGCR